MKVLLVGEETQVPGAILLGYHSWRHPDKLHAGAHKEEDVEADEDPEHHSGLPHDLTHINLSNDGQESHYWYLSVILTRISKDRNITQNSRSMELSHCSLLSFCDVVCVTRLTHRTLQKSGLPPLWCRVSTGQGHTAQAEGGS